MVEKTIISFENGQWHIHSFFGQIGTHTEPCWHQVERLSKFVPPDTLEMHSVALPVLRFCKTFSKILRLTLQKLFFVDDFLKIHIFKQKICYAYKLVRAAKLSEFNRCSKYYKTNHKNQWKLFTLKKKQIFAWFITLLN